MFPFLNKTNAIISRKPIPKIASPWRSWRLWSLPFQAHFTIIHPLLQKQNSPMNRELWRLVSWTHPTHHTATRTPQPGTRHVLLRHTAQPFPEGSRLVQFPEGKFGLETQTYAQLPSWIWVPPDQHAAQCCIPSQNHKVFSDGRDP